MKICISVDWYIGINFGAVFDRDIGGEVGSRFCDGFVNNYGGGGWVMSCKCSYLW